MPSDLKYQFSVVFLDPPWYLNDYVLWINREADLLGQGRIVFALYPVLTRPMAVQERAELFETLHGAGIVSGVYSGSVVYLVPSFESHLLEKHGFPYRP